MAGVLERQVLRLLISCVDWDVCLPGKQKVSDSDLQNTLFEKQAASPGKAERGC